MRCCLCVKLQPCEILPGLQEAYYPETDCRAYAEKTCPYYAIEEKTACFTGRSGRVSCMGKGLIPNPVKMGFYCVTYNQNCTYKKTGRGGYFISCRVPSFFLFLPFLINNRKNRFHKSRDKFQICSLCIPLMEVTPFSKFVAVLC